MTETEQRKIAIVDDDYAVLKLDPASAGGYGALRRSICVSNGFLELGD